jgi:prolyl-tRNA synthetase
MVKGCMVIKPHGYAIWEKIQAELDRRFKATGPPERLFSAADPESVPEEGSGARRGLRDGAAPS